MLRHLLKTMRPKQWAKQVFIPAALVADGKLLDSHYVARTLAAIAVFCLVSSAVYVMNDLADIEKDRAHPVKRNRPLPSGKLSPRVAAVAAVVLVVASIAGAAALGVGFLEVTVAYLLVNVAYTFYLKEVLILDLLSIAAFYLLRVVAGVVVVDVARFSPWLYVCASFLALFIAINKRRQEQVLLAGNASTHRTTLAGYTLPLLDQFTMIVVSATLMAYSLYTFSAPNLPVNHAMMLTIPFVIYGVFRYMYLVQVKGLGGAPEEVVLRDKPLLIDVALYGLAVVTVLYLLPPGA
ncbi:MAG: decaprenyl-phosphate phosphoribosyltransferase [Anaerolineae bacterium]